MHTYIYTHTLFVDLYYRHAYICVSYTCVLCDASQTHITYTHTYAPMMHKIMYACDVMHKYTPTHIMHIIAYTHYVSCTQITYTPTYVMHIHAYIYGAHTRVHA